MVPIVTGCVTGCVTESPVRLPCLGMCGIVAVLKRRSEADMPSAEGILGDVESALLALGAPADLARLAAAADLLESVDARLRGSSGVRALLASTALREGLESRLSEISSVVGRIEGDLDRHRLPLAGAELEAANAALLRVKDATWALSRDRLRGATEVGLLAGAGAGPAALAACWSIQAALSALERLEVRGRDSAGLHLLVTGPGFDPTEPSKVATELAARSADPLFRSMSVRVLQGGVIAFVYKAAAEIGELGDNIRALRSAIGGDSLLRRALSAPEAEVAVLGHTRWASVGIISEANAHPLNDEEQGRSGPYVAASLNGDVDNHMELRAAEGLVVPPEITTDAKVIPMLVSRRLSRGSDLPGGPGVSPDLVEGPGVSPDLPGGPGVSPDLVEAFRETVATFEGSVAIGAATDLSPGRLLLALRGSGQALYIGLAEDAYVVTSEPYGLIEETNRYLRMDGEVTDGQIVVLDRDGAGTLAGIDRRSYAGHPLPIDPSEICTAEITTRDVDRAGYPHFLLKELSEAPQSFRKTLRGKVVEHGARLAVALGEDTLPVNIRRRLAKGLTRRIYVIGQGTAAVAGQILAHALASFLPPSSGITTSALPATELSGFGLDDDMSDALVIAISQSGTTTDTNRTVDLVRARGAGVLAIVNRRNSDLVEKADGVLYTSDGRDVEMSVPSTKAFYAQVAAGYLLALALAEEAGGADAKATHEVLAGLRDLPEAMERVLEARPEIAAAAWAHAPRRRHWAVVGNGPNRFTAMELRIKLSELAYKSIAFDATEDKKHIDLSSEPLILVCATGLNPAAAADVAKELAIYRAHKAAPVVIGTEGTEWPSALATITVPAVHPKLAFVLSAMAGHLFGYEAALAIDAQARSLREVRAGVEEVLSADGTVGRPNGDRDGLGDDLADRLARRVRPGERAYHEALRAGTLNGSLEAGTAAELSSVLRYATGTVPLEFYELDHGRVGTPGAVVEDLLEALSRAIDELTRPVDAIRHQAKTVTVGISRSEEELFTAPLVAEVLAAGAQRNRLTYRVLRSLVALEPAVAEVDGFTRYRIDGPPASEPATIAVIGKGGIAAGLRSRAEGDGARLRGTKHRAATLREVTVAKGATDGRTVVLVPEIHRGEVVGMTLLHARFADRLPGAEMRAVLEGYQSRYGALVDAVTESQPEFDDGRLGDLAVIDLLTSPVHVLATAWAATAE